jgi:hypothetical protein
MASYCDDIMLDVKWKDCEHVYPTQDDEFKHDLIRIKGEISRNHYDELVKLCHNGTGHVSHHINLFLTNILYNRYTTDHYCEYAINRNIYMCMINSCIEKSMCDNYDIINLYEYTHRLYKTISKSTSQPINKSTNNPFMLPATTQSTHTKIESSDDDESMSDEEIAKHNELKKSFALFFSMLNHTTEHRTYYVIFDHNTISFSMALSLNDINMEIYIQLSI